MIRLLALAPLAVLAAACAPTQEAEPPVDGALGQCKAAQYQSFVGRDRSQLPPAPAGEVWRVVCDTCPVTMDYNPARLNVIYDTQTNVVEEVKCG